MIHRAGVEGSSEELDEFGLVLKFTWGNPQLQPKTHTHTLAWLHCPPPSHPASMIWESARTPSVEPHLLCD